MSNTWDNRPINTGYTVVDGTTTGNYNNGHPELIVHTWMEYLIIPHTTADETANQTRIDIKLYSEVHQPQGSGTGMSYTSSARDFGYAGWDGGNRTPYNCTYNFNNFARVTFFDGTITVPHNADGTKTITLEAGFTTLPETWAITGGSASASVTLPTIIQKTEIVSVSGLKYGYNTTVQLSRKASNLRETAVLAISGTNISLKSTSDANADFTFVLARTYAPTTAFPCALTGTLTVETFNGATSLGSVSQSVTFTADGNDNAFAPTLTAEPVVVAYNDVVSALGTDTAVATYSKINVSAQKADVSLKYGATIAERYVEFQDGRRVSLDQTDHISNIINSAGMYGWTYVVSDSRGFPCFRSGNFNVVNAVMPSAIASVWRGNSDGTPNEFGTYIFAQATATYESYNGHNSVSMTAQVGSDTPVALTDGVRATLKTNASASTPYQVYIDVTDILATNRLSFSLSSAHIPLHIRASGRGVGIGKYCDTDDELQIGYDTDIDGELTVRGVPVLTVSVAQDLSADVSESCSSTLTGSSCYVTIPANRGGLYAITAKASADNGAPQEIVLIKWKQGDASATEQVARQDAEVTSFGAIPLNASAVFRLSVGEIVQIYVKYDVAGTNHLYLNLHQIAD